ncbi:MAG: hypothetical protein H6679_02870 [Epsilonproteobacteria bacterium]|nr:hypothetical protein [Campylobacterota bacterium]
MVLISYLSRRFSAYFLTFSLLLAVLVNFVEFVEKVVRTDSASLTDIAYFVGINFVVSLFDLAPQASWLATFFLLRELASQHEWDVLNLVGLTPQKCMAYVFGAGLLLAGGIAVVKEVWIVPLASHAQRYKLETFKQQSVDAIVDRWLMFDDGVFGHVGSFDFRTGQGTNLLLLYVDDVFLLKKIITAPTFNFGNDADALLVQQARLYDQASGQHSQLVEQTIMLQGFLPQLKADVQVPTLANLLGCVFGQGMHVPWNVRNELLYAALKRIVEYMHLILYPLLTFVLFALFVGSAQRSWFVLFIPYFLITLLGIWGDFLVLGSGVSAWLLLMLYFPVFLFLLSSLFVLA